MTLTAMLIRFYSLLRDTTTLDRKTTTEKERDVAPGEESQIWAQVAKHGFGKWREGWENVGQGKVYGHVDFTRM